LKKIVSIVGARPQFIKAAAFSRVVRRKFGEVLVHTGQHYDRNMSARFFSELGIPAPDYQLGIGSGTHAEQTGRMLGAVERVLLREKPAGVVIFGDTNSTVAAALAAVKLKIPVAHIEAGLRSFNRDMPEEHNRVVSDHLSDLLFVPSRQGMANLKREGLGARAYLVGDIMYDSLLGFARIARERSRIIGRLGLKKDGYYLATVHRPSNTDDKKVLKAVLSSLSGLDLPVVFPVHPRTRERIKRFGLAGLLKGIVLTEPAGYLDIIRLMMDSRKVITDSGGLQKEAFYLRKQCVVLRSESEWIELVSSGWAVLTGSDPGRIRRAVLSTRKPRLNSHPYGRGKAADRIVRILASHW